MKKKKKVPRVGVETLHDHSARLRETIARFHAGPKKDGKKLLARYQGMSKKDKEAEYGAGPGMASEDAATPQSGPGEPSSSSGGNELIVTPGMKKEEFASQLKEIMQIQCAVTDAFKKVVVTIRYPDGTHCKIEAQATARDSRAVEPLLGK